MQDTLKNQTDANNQDIEETEHRKHTEVLKTLDDWQTAQKFYIAKLASARENLSQITMLTSGLCEPTEHNSQHGHALLLEILEIFQIRHKNFDSEQFAEDLQFHLFTSSMEHDDAFRRWKRDRLASLGLDYYGEPVESTSSESNAGEVQKRPGNPANRTLQTIADKLANVLADKNISDEIKNPIKDIILEASNESDFGGITEPFVIRTAFPQLIGSLNQEFGKGIVQSLRAILDGIERQPAENDFSESDGELETLANQISEILNHPLLPKNLKNVIADEMNDEEKGDIFTPESVRHNLKLLQKAS